MNVTLSRIIGDSFSTAIKNIPSMLGASILWLLTCWVPYINVGTTIALFYGMPLELSKGKIMNPTAIFDAKYRKYMGEFFSCVGLMLLSIIPALFFMVVPAIIISIGWMFAVIFIVDKEMNPAQAMTASTQYTYGYKWLIFLSQLIIWIILSVGSALLFYIAVKINVFIIFLLVMLFITALMMSINIAFNGVMYKLLVVERDTPVSSEVG